MNILWDLDGTLVDSMPVIAQAMNQTRAAFDLAPLSFDELRPFIGPSIHPTFAHFLNTNDDALVDAAVRHYRALCDDTLADIPVFEGVESVLGALAEAGCQQFVATAKYRPVARELLTLTGLDRWFIEVYGSEDGGVFGHKPELLAHLLSEEGLSPAETLMIGDTHYDMEAARANDLTAIGVAWGYGENNALQEGGAHRLVDTPDELLAAIRASLVCVC
ncbi:HAD family hydrolase [Saccharospirillum sp. MSK14-1]|uniref:HAD family hydrolase n=1 Tax=Saccharospirillum sp. MSK14-1 TaxID=1897632 RepID=UPI001304F569|nr:HAD hydrolase-like protein [Saccharospirillum sp. MSK14-1]